MPSDIDSIIVLNDFCSVQGGASRVAIDEAVALAAQGLAVTFLGASGPIGPELRASAARTICLGQPALADVGHHPGVALQGLWNRVAGRRMNSLLAGLDPARTVVHLHGYTKSLTTSPVRAAVNAGFPVVHTLHDYFAMCPSGNYYDYVREAPCRLPGLSAACISTRCDKRNHAHKLYRVVRGALQLWPGLMPSGIRDFIALSRRSEQLLRMRLPAGARVHHLANIVDITRQAPVDVASNESVLFVGRLDPEKGVQVLLDAADRTGVSLVFVGDGPLRTAIEARGRHRVTGWLNAERVRDELRRARCLVFPSRWHETFGMVVSEAAALGVPAIVSDISAASERIRSGVTGLVFPSADRDALVGCLESTREAALMAAMGCNAWAAFWAAPPTRDHHVRGLLAVYRQMLMTRSAAAGAEPNLPREVQ